MDGPGIFGRWGLHVPKRRVGLRRVDVGNHVFGTTALPSSNESRSSASRSSWGKTAETAKLPTRIAPIDAEMLEFSGREAQFQDLPGAHNQLEEKHRGRVSEPRSRWALFVEER